MWTATIIDRKVDASNPTVGIVVTVTYTDGTQTDTRSHGGIGSLDGVNAVIAAHVAQLNDAAALANAVALGQVSVPPPLTAAQVSALKPYFNAALDDIQNRDALNAATVANPVAQGQVLQPMDTTAILGMLSAASLAKLYGRPHTATIRQDVRTQDRAAVQQWANLALASGDVTQAEHDSIVAATTATIPDPAWQAQVSRAVVQIGRAVTLTDMALVRAG